MIWVNMVRRFATCDLAEPSMGVNLDVSLTDASLASGSKYSVHQGDHCSGGGWDAVEGGVWRAYAKEKSGTKALDGTRGTRKSGMKDT